MVVVYALRNTVTGFNYVGCTKDAPKRFREHRSVLNAGEHSSPPLQADWNKQGGKGFELVVLEELPADSNVIHKRARELYWMQFFSNKRNCYNMHQVSFSPTRAAIDLGQGALRASGYYDPQRMKNLHSDPETHASLVRGLVSAENREGNRQRQLSRWSDPEYRAKMLKALARGRENR